MELSATRLGDRIGLNGQEMNMLLKKEGFLAGEPGNYSITEKGLSFVKEKGWDNGYGGYAARGYNYNTYNESILECIDISPERIKEIRDIVSKQRIEKIEAAKEASKDYWETQAKKNQATKTQTAKNDCVNIENNYTKELLIVGIITIALAGGTYLVYRMYKKKKDKNNNLKEDK